MCCTVGCKHRGNVISGGGRIGMGMFNKGGGRDDGAFEMRRDGPLLKFGAVGVGVILVLVVLGVFLLRVTRIEAGHGGVEINLACKQRGGSEITVRTGWVGYSPLSTQNTQLS